ncbi:hypothetical protein ACFO9Q_10215 [Paenibacillus sp. GCM10023252]|uniref:hypothetical protein n=1 Tax=Paenibacillus sp. GCM10023252 TaxID=3252649 RepID=UPI0036071391
MALTLVPLRISIGWKVCWNTFFEINPDEFINKDFEYKWEFNEDIFQFVHESQRKILDLGWYPETDPKGQFHLKLIMQCDNEDDQSNAWQDPLISYKTRNYYELILKIEEILNEVSHGNQ